MRLWSCHLSYVDLVGLGRCWSEGLGGLRALRGQQKMHENHSQLIRFKTTGKPEEYLSDYLWTVYRERLDRTKEKPLAPGTFNTDLLLPWGSSGFESKPIKVTTKQVRYEFNLLQGKLGKRDDAKANLNESEVYVKGNGIILPNTFFELIDGPIESWERVKKL
jgi:hypothetical protein